MRSLTGGDSDSTNPGSGGRHGNRVRQRGLDRELNDGYGNSAPVAQRRQAVARALDDGNGGSVITCREGKKGEARLPVPDDKNTVRRCSLPGDSDNGFRLGAVRTPRFYTLRGLSHRAQRPA
jgi:hypothetical protein